MTRSKLIVTRAPLLSVTPGALRWLVALATLAAAPLARADAPPAPGPSSPATPAPSDSSTGPSGQVTATSPSGQVTATGPSGQVTPTATEPTRCQDRRDLEWVRRCTPERNTFELGVFAGVLFPAANSHELFDAYKQRDARRDGQEFWRPYQTAAPDLGLRLAYFPLRFLGGELEGALMPTRIVEDGRPGARATLFSARAHLVAQLPFWRVAPFVVLGSGGFGTTGALGNDFDPMTHMGGGVKLFIGQRSLLRLDVRANVAARKEVDAGATSYSEVLLGFSTVLGRKQPRRAPEKDSDGDGFLDRSDACPYEPGRAPDGCPERDRDGDGFMDGQDACPDVPGIAPDGCPEQDRDGDGFLDSVDKCPDDPGVEPDGCPIPDTDGDGFLDDVDKCIDRPETFNGFEDDDGCPDRVPDKIPTGVIRGIYFDLDRDTIKPRSRPVLDRAVAVFLEFPSVRVEISGHTDSTGALAYNHDLSRRRAESVKRYLVEHGIDAARIQTRGAGPDEPIDTNRSAAGRAKNRRIEFDLLVGR
jgi:outer membrane protein OmpA-like peptidoglycan-associated protein